MQYTYRIVQQYKWSFGCCSPDHLDEQPRKKFINNILHFKIFFLYDLLEKIFKSSILFFHFVGQWQELLKKYRLEF